MILSRRFCDFFMITIVALSSISLPRGEDQSTPSSGYPLIISIHGGAWAYADRHNDLILRHLTNDGYALAKIDYRLAWMIEPLLEEEIL